jgi:hypothetical protein
MMVQQFKYLLGMLILSACCQSALAIAPANTQIQASAILTYEGLSTPITVSVSVKVILKTASPNVEIPLENTVAERQPSEAILIFTSTANGLDTYPLTAALTLDGVENTDTPQFLFNSVIVNSVSLGATAAEVQAAAGQASIVVPFDGSAGNSVNGIVAGDKVLIGDLEYDVEQIIDNGSNKTIVLKQDLTVMVPFGTLIAERKEIVLKILDVGSLTGPPPGFTETRVTVTNSGSELREVTHKTNVVAVTFEKYVRNTSTPNGNADDSISILGSTYYSDTNGRVLAARDEVLEYAIIVVAPDGADLNDVRVSDVVPLFTFYNSNTTLLNGITVADDGLELPLLSPGILVDNNSSRGSEDIATGTITAGSTAVVTFRVTVE